MRQGLAIINGARSLAFYGGNLDRCWNESDTTRGWNWTFWDKEPPPPPPALQPAAAPAGPVALRATRASSVRSGRLFTRRIRVTTDRDRR